VNYLQATEKLVALFTELKSHYPKRSFAIPVKKEKVKKISIPESDELFKVDFSVKYLDEENLLQLGPHKLL